MFNENSNLNEHFYSPTDDVILYNNYNEYEINESNFFQISQIFLCIVGVKESLSTFIYFSLLFAFIQRLLCFIG